MMTNSYELLDLLRNMSDVLLIILFCRSLPSKDIEKYKKYLCILCMLVLQVVFFYFVKSDFLFNGRMLLRIFSTILYIKICKNCRLLNAVYISLLLSVCVTGCHNIFMAPYLRDYRIGVIKLFSNPQLNSAFFRTTVILFDFAIILLMSVLLNLQSISSGLKTRIGIAASLLTIELFVKHMLKLYADTLTYGIDLTMFAVIVSALAIMLIVLYERFILLREEKAEQERLSLARSYAYESAMNSHQMDMEVRRLHHDMKNHITALNALCSADNNTQLRDYLKSMGSILEAYEASIDTGSPVINGLLSDKMRKAQNLKLQLKLAVDISSCSFLSDSDLCIILGNILDNALEAAAGIPDEQKRFISLKIGSVSGSAIIRCTNSCLGKLTSAGDHLPLTTKADKQHHGLGLPSVKQVVKRHNGYLTIDNTESQFTILMILPR